MPLANTTKGTETVWADHQTIAQRTPNNEPLVPLLASAARKRDIILVKTALSCSG